MWVLILSQASSTQMRRAFAPTRAARIAGPARGDVAMPVLSIGIPPSGFQPVVEQCEQSRGQPVRNSASGIDGEEQWRSDREILQAESRSEQQKQRRRARHHV